jgi:hypothetical protein
MPKSLSMIFSRARTMQQALIPRLGDTDVHRESVVSRWGRTAPREIACRQKAGVLTAFSPRKGSAVRRWGFKRASWIDTVFGEAAERLLRHDSVSILGSACEIRGVVEADLAADFLDGNRVESDEVADVSLLRVFRAASECHAA